MPLTHSLRSLRLAAAAVAVAGLGTFAAPSFASDCCSPGTSDQLTDNTQFISTQAEEGQGQAEGQAAEQDQQQAKMTAEEMLAKLQTVQSYEEAEPLLKDFVKAYPEHEQAPQFMYILASRTSDQEEKKALYKQLVELHPDTQFGQMAQGSLKQMEGVGKPFELKFEELRSGETLSVQEDLKGKVVVIDFWATWCGPCIAEMPNMKKLYEQYKDQGVEFIGVSLDAPESQGGREKLVQYVEQNNVPWPQYYQGNGWDSEFSKSWGVNAIPQLFIVDAEGKLHSVEARGQLEEMIPALIKQRDEKTGEQAAAN